MELAHGLEPSLDRELGHGLEPSLDMEHGQVCQQGHGLFLFEPRGRAGVLEQQLGPGK